MDRRSPLARFDGSWPDLAKLKENVRSQPKADALPDELLEAIDDVEADFGSAIMARRRQAENQRLYQIFTTLHYLNAIRLDRNACHPATTTAPPTAEPRNQ
jgi:hypothetical protein